MKVKIYQPIKTPTQSGKKAKPWLIALAQEEDSRAISDLTGWTSSFDTKSQLKLKFQNSEDAAAYAKSQGWEYTIIQPKTLSVIKKSYADNFS